MSSLINNDVLQYIRLLLLKREASKIFPLRYKLDKKQNCKNISISFLFSLDLHWNSISVRYYSELNASNLEWYTLNHFIKYWSESLDKECHEFFRNDIFFSSLKSNSNWGLVVGYFKMVYKLSFFSWSFSQPFTGLIYWRNQYQFEYLLKYN